MTFLKMRDDASQKLPSVICAWRRFWFLIHACLSLAMDKMSDRHLQVFPNHLFRSSSSSAHLRLQSLLGRITDHYLLPICIPL